ncbi:MAG: alanine racemase [Woeseia sp.]
MTCGARALIRLGALKHNLRRIREAANGAKVLAVVKADAYGHGLTTVAESLPDVDGFAVARYREAIELDDAGIRKPIVLLEGICDAAELEDALRRRFQLVVHCDRQIELLEDAPPGAAAVWLKLDTGMHRLGFDPAGTPRLVTRLNACRAVGEVRLMTHLANADNPADDMTARQLDTFRRASNGFDGHVSIANSPGLFAWPEAISAGHERSRSWVRAGISLYGISPFSARSGCDLGLRAVMEFSSTLIGVKSVRAGDAVGYGATWQAPQDTVIGIVSAGYGDGYTRFLPSGTPVLVNGRRRSLAGRISMDMAAVDLGPGATDRIGAPVTLWGEGLPLEDIAAYAGTIPYQLLCGVTQRTPRIAVD